MAKTKTRLARTARGLPRFYMDCGWYRHPNWAGLPLESLGLFQAIVGYCTEHATDGAMPSDVEDLAAALGLRVSGVRKALKPLIDRGRLIQSTDGRELLVPGWEDHNPTSDEVETYVSERAESGTRGNHIRWHVKEGVWKPDVCSFCAKDGPPPDSPSPDDDSPPPSDPPPDRSSDSVSDRSSDSEPIATGIANGSHGMGWDGMGWESEPVDGFNREAIARPVDNSELRVRRLATRLVTRGLDANLGDSIRLELRHVLDDHPGIPDDEAEALVWRRLTRTTA